MKENKIEIKWSGWRHSPAPLLAKHKDDLWLTNKKSSTVVRLSSLYYMCVVTNVECRK